MIKNFFAYLIKAFKWGIISISVLIVLVISLISYLNQRWLLTGYVKEFMNHHIEGSMEFDSLQFDFNEFPLIGVQLSNGLLVGHMDIFPNDTLCSVEYMNVKINPLKILKENLIDIPYVYLIAPKVNVRLNKDGKPDWAIWRFKKQKSEQPTDTLKKNNNKDAIQLYIKEVDIRKNPIFHYDNKKLRNTITAKAEQGFLIGRIAIDYKRLNADTLCFTGIDYNMDFRNTGLKIDALNSDILISKRDSNNWMKTYLDISGYMKKTVINNKKIFTAGDITLLGNVDFKNDFKSFVFKSFQIDMGKDYLNISGLLKPGIHDVFTSLELHFQTTDLKTFFSKFPMINNKFVKNVSYDLPLNVDLSIAGAYSTDGNAMPNISSEIHIANAMVKYDSLPEINDIFFDGYMKYKPEHRYVNIDVDSLSLNTLNSNIEGKAEVQGAIKTPSLSVETKGNISLEDINKFVPQIPLDCSGELDFNLNIKTNDLKFTTHSFYNDIIKGNISFKDLKIQDKKSDMLFATKSGGVNIKNEVRRENVDAEFYMQNAELITDSTFLTIDTVDISASMPTMTDSLAYFTLDTRRNFMVLKKDTIKVNNIYTEIIASFRDVNFNSLDSINVLMVLNRFGLDSDSVKVICDNSALSLEAIAKNNYGMINSMNDFIFNSNFNGGIIINNGQIITNNPFINGSVNNATLLFDQDIVNIKDINVRTAYSQFELDGQIKNWRKYIYKKDTISADLSLISDSLNFNLLYAYIKQLNSNKNKKDSIVLQAPDTVPQSIIPSNINLKLSLDMNDILYNGVGGNDLTGMLLVTESSLFLHNLILRSPMAYMNMDISLHTVENLYEGNLDLSISNFDVQKVIANNPKIIDIVPLAKTLKGELGVTIAMKSLFNHRFSPIEQSIYGNADFQGSNLSVEKDKVLPKWVGTLLLGRKKFINIDSLRFYMSIDEDVMSIYPFETAINKYKFDISGMQNFDDSFFYHLTLLKWFLPFKLGFNIYGKPDKLHIKLACPKKNNFYMPSKVLNANMKNLLPHNYVNKNIEDASYSINQNYYNFMQKYNDILGKDDLKRYKKERSRIINQLDNLIENKKFAQ